MVFTLILKEKDKIKAKGITVSYTRKVAQHFTGNELQCQMK